MFHLWLLAISTRNESSRVQSSHCLPFVFSPWRSGVMSGWSLIIESKIQSTRTATQLLVWHRETLKLFLSYNFDHNPRKQHIHFFIHTKKE